MKALQTSNGSTFFVDNEDLVKVLFFRWNANSDGYVSSGAGRGQILLHRLLVEAPAGTLVDHKDRNPLNNCKDNLRLATRSQNQHNRSKNRNNTSGYKGVSFCKTRGKWRAQICLNNVRKPLGYFSTPEEAHKAYCQAAKACHGEFARGT